MKIRNFIFFVFISFILSGLIFIVSILVQNNKEISIQINQNQIHIPNSYRAASISKGTILLLLAVGVIGLLGISRKKKGFGSITKRNGTSIGPENQKSNKNEQKMII